MPYTDRFISTDNLVNHFNSAILGQVNDAQLLSNYAGFFAVSAVTVYELAIKDIFEDFAKKKNKVFGNFIHNHFEKINGRIKLKDLKDEHIKRFGTIYVDKFKKKLDEKDIAGLRDPQIGISIKSCYSNLIVNRHDFVHQGHHNLSLQEAIQNYFLGKEVINTLDQTMRR